MLLVGGEGWSGNVAGSNAAVNWPCEAPFTGLQFQAIQHLVVVPSIHSQVKSLNDKSSNVTSYKFINRGSRANITFIKIIEEEKKIQMTWVKELPLTNCRVFR